MNKKRKTLMHTVRDFIDFTRFRVFTYVGKVGCPSPSIEKAQKCAKRKQKMLHGHRNAVIGVKRQRTATKETPNFNYLKDIFFHSFDLSNVRYLRCSHALLCSLSISLPHSRRSLLILFHLNKDQNECYCSSIPVYYTIYKYTCAYPPIQMYKHMNIFIFVWISTVCVCVL